MLIKELQSLALDIKVLDGDGNEIILKETIDDDDVEELPVNIAGFEDDDVIASESSRSDDEDIEEEDEESTEDDIIDEVTQILESPHTQSSDIFDERAEELQSFEELKASETFDFDDEEY